jgi:haloalkane dehalogenase
MTDAVRPPDELFEGLPDYPFEAQFRQVDGLRLAHVDEGEGAPVVFWHGEPTWSYLWRHVIPPVGEAGFRCVAPDLVGFGRSDKPMDLGWYSYDRHCELAASLVEDLDLRDATFVVHDWGGPIGLRVAVEHPDRVSRLVVLDTGLWTGRQKMSDAWWAFRNFVQRTVDLPISFLVDGATKRELTEEEKRAYDAPFPSVESKAGARAFPLLIPHEEDGPGAAEGRAVLEALAQDDRPMLFLWAAEDPVLSLKVGERFADAVGHGGIDHVIPEASHFLQEDQGPLIGEHVARWLTSTT